MRGLSQIGLTCVKRIDIGFVFNLFWISWRSIWELINRYCFREYSLICLILIKEFFLLLFEIAMMDYRQVWHRNNVIEHKFKHKSQAPWNSHAPLFVPLLEYWPHIIICKHQSDCSNHESHRVSDKKVSHLFKLILELTLESLICYGEKFEKPKD